MSSFPGSPRLLRGGLVLVDPTTGAVLRIIALQYNPDTLTRSLQVKGVTGESGDHLEALRLKGPPVETIKVEAEIDATDQLETDDPQTTQSGLHPQLAVLEVLVYPTSAQLFSNNNEASAGSIEIAPELAPLPLFVFGPRRVVPVRITELSITEEAFDPALNPIRAKVSLGLRVLTINDVNFEDRAGMIYMAHLREKERLAGLATQGRLSALGVEGLL